MALSWPLNRGSPDTPIKPHLTPGVRPSISNRGAVSKLDTLSYPQASVYNDPWTPVYSHRLQEPGLKVLSHPIHFKLQAPTGTTESGEKQKYSFLRSETIVWNFTLTLNVTPVSFSPIFSQWQGLTLSHHLNHSPKTHTFF